jgi:Caspase domain
MSRLEWSRLGRFLLFACLLYVASVEAALSQQQGKRVALVIGNSHYGGEDNVSGIEDAKQMKATLQQMGFQAEDIALVTDGELNEIGIALKDFGERIKKASVVVFFFSGHGFQSGAENYLLPTDGSVAPESALPLTTIKDTLAWAPNEAIKLVFLDACRKYKKLPENAPQGLREEQVPSLPRTLYAFAAGPGLNTPAGEPHEISAYSGVLLHYLKEPGLKITELLDKVTKDSVTAGRLPAYVINGVPSDFRLRDPVYVRAELSDVHGDLFVMVNDEVVLTSNQGSTGSLPLESLSAKLPLKAGHNKLTLLMFKGKSYRNTHSWDVTEGWSYNLKIGLRDAGTISCSGSNQNGYCFSGRERHPFKDGPHHGGGFVVATATLVVDGKYDPPRVTLEASDTDVWKRNAPFWARDQELLYEQSVESLKLKPEDLLSGLNLEPPWDVLLRPLVQQLLTTGKLLGHEVAVPSKTFATVWGNKVFRDAVRTCMTEHRDERISDLKASIAAVFGRKDKPFEGFDDGLAACVRGEVAGSRLTEDDIQIWTAIQDRSKD